jgi:hypothetical protein
VELPIIDLSGAWLTPMVAAIKLAVPYFFVDHMSARLISFREIQYKPIISLIGANCSSEEINGFSTSLSDCITQAKKDYQTSGLFIFFDFILF